MQRVLILTTTGSPVAVSISRAIAHEAAIGVARLDGTLPKAVQAVIEAGGGKIPDVIIVDISQGADCILLRQARRVVQTVWGDDVPLPPTLAILTPPHLAQPDWPAFSDDFLTPERIADELAARVRLLLFKQNHGRPDEPVGFADVWLEPSTGRVRLAGSGRAVALTPREAELLKFLVTHRGKFFARDRLLDLVWGVDYEGGERTVDIHMRRLRAKLPPIAASLLETRRGVGYGLRVPE